MAKNNKTIFQRLGTVIKHYSGNDDAIERSMFTRHQPDKVLFQTDNKEEYEQKMNTLAQEKLLGMQWVKAGVDNMENTIKSQS